MLSTLPDSLNTFFASNRKTVSSLIREMKLNKIDITSLASKLINGQNFGDFSGSLAKKYSIMEKEPIVDLFRDSSIRIRKLYNAVNAGGLVLDSIVSVIGSEIEKVEKDLNDLQLFIDNYEFIAGKDDLYNVNYVEKFDNLLGDYRFDGYNFVIPDRNLTQFSSGGNVFVDTSTGIMKIGSSQSVKNVIKNIKSVKIFNNYQNYITSTEPFENLFNDNLIDSWNVTIKSPSILTSGLSEFSKYINYSDTLSFGATTAVEITFNQAVNMDTIRITPNLGADLQLKQIVIFDASNVNYNASTTGESYINVLNNYKIINNKLEVTFNATSVNKIIFIFNQSSYTRSKKNSINSELNSKAIQAFIDQRLNEKKNSFSVYQDIAYWYFKRRYLINGLKKNSNSDIEYYSNRFPYEVNQYLKMVEDELFKASNNDLSDKQIFTNSPLFIDLIKNVMNYIGLDTDIIGYDYFIENGLTSKKNAVINYPGFISQKSSNAINDPKLQFFKDTVSSGSLAKAVSRLLIEEPEDSYEYSFSLKSIEFIKTNSSSIDKACFVSKKIPVEGQVLGLKAKLVTLDNVAISTNNGFDLKSNISYELSISNSDYPINESDWHPLAVNDSNIVDSEVVFFDISNFSYSPRFIPRSDSIILFKDGTLIPPSKYSYSITSNKLELLDTSLYSPLSIFCIKYNINDSVYDPYEIDFIKTNIYKEAVKQYSSTNGLGQVFSRTGSNGMIELSFMPYINYALRRSSRYDRFYGTIFSDNSTGYSPVKIRLSDGSYAVNLTNYTRSAQPVSFFGNSSTQFIQNGKSIVFNKTIISPFTVFYEYVPNSIRFRLVMRKNIPSIDVSGKADAVFLKLKTAYFDPYYDKLNYVSRN